MEISVCMATYNGANFIEEQFLSILSQLGSNDELIVVDDCSKDSTVKIIKRFNDSRIKIFLNQRNMGHVYSFGRAISMATKDIIFMSDQDDIWIENRVELMVNKLSETYCLLVSSNSAYIDMAGREILYKLDDLRAVDSTEHLKNIKAIFTGKIGYYGCAMAFRKKLISLILPIPNFVESHDLWIAMAANMMRSNVHLEEKTLVRRVHTDNASIVRRRLPRKLWSRWIFLISLFVLITRAIRYDNIKLLH